MNSRIQNPESRIRLARLLPLICIAFAALVLAGCTTAVKNGNIISITERCIGLDIAQSPATQTPHVRFGFISSTVTLIPTSKGTNATGGASIVSPAFAHSFSAQGAGILNGDIDESTSSGGVGVQTAYEGTNAVSVPLILPASFPQFTK